MKSKPQQIKDLKSTIKVLCLVIVIMVIIFSVKILYVMVKLDNSQQEIKFLESQIPKWTLETKCFFSGPASDESVGIFQTNYTDYEQYQKHVVFFEDKESCEVLR